MFQLKSDNYYKVKHLFRNIDINTLFAECVVSGFSDGQIWVDNIKNPNSFYIKNSCGMSLFYGSDNTFIFNVLSHRIDSNETLEGAQIYPRSQYETFVNSLSKLKINKREYTRLNFKLNIIKFKQNCMELKSTKTEIIDYKTYSDITGRVIPSRFFYSVEDFKKNGIGVYIEEAGRAVSYAFSAFKDDKHLEIGIETREEYRGNNYAFSCAKKLIDIANKEGKEALWSCEEENIGSYRLATKLGFEVTKKHPIFVI